MKTKEYLERNGKMKSDELNPVSLVDAYELWANRDAYVYNADEVDEAIAELKDELNRAKAREDVLVTDNRNLLEKVKMLEGRLRENAEHFKRNEAQILEASDNEIKKLKRVLWLSKAERAVAEQTIEECNEYDYTNLIAMPDEVFEKTKYSKNYETVKKWRDTMLARI